MADWYDALAAERGTEFHQQVIVPGLLRLLDLKPGEKVCDLACGQGAVTQALHRASGQVTGVDLSPRLNELAEQRSPKGIRYLVSDARHVPALKSGAFDAVTCVLAAMNMDPVEPLFAEMARLLRSSSPLPAGEGQGEGVARPRHGPLQASALARAVIVILHPAFRIPRQSRWKWDEGRKMLLREMDGYLVPKKLPIDMRPFNDPDRTVTMTYHRPAGTYVNGLAQAGLWVNAFEEWPSYRKSQPGPRAKAEDRARNEFPLFLALRAVKVDTAGQ